MATYQVETEGGTYEVETSDTPETSVPGAVGRGALDAIPFGVKGGAALQAGIAGGSYDHYLSELDKLIESDKEQHPIAHGAGEVAGAVAPFLIPGVGEALGAETLAGRAGIGAGIGALQGASATREPLTSEEGLTEIAKGAGTGAILNPALGAVGDALSGGLSKAAGHMAKVSDEQAVKTLGMRPSVLGHMDEAGVQDLGSFAKQHDLVSGPIEERLKSAKVAKQVFGNKISEMGEKAATVEDISPYIQELQDKSLRYSGSSAPEAQAMGKTYAGAVQDMQGQLLKGASYSDVQELKEMYGHMAFDANHQVKNQAAADAYTQLRKLQNDLVTKSPDEFKNIMKGYSQTSDIVDGLQKQLGQNRAGSGGGSTGIGLRGMVRQIPGMKNPAIAVPAGAAIAAAGHPYLGAMAATGSIAGSPGALSGLAGAASKGLSAAASGASHAAPALTGMAEHGMETELAHHAALHTAHQQVEKIPSQYAPVFQKAVEGLNSPEEKQKQITITDFVLQSRDPNYSKAKQSMSEESNAF